MFQFSQPWLHWYQLMGCRKLQSGYLFSQICSSFNIVHLGLPVRSGHLLYQCLKCPHYISIHCGGFCFVLLFPSYSGFFCFFFFLGCVVFFFKCWLLWITLHVLIWKTYISMSIVVTIWCNKWWDKIKIS